MMASQPLENEAFVNQLVEDICQRGWRIPALIGLEVGQPLAFLGGQLLWMAQPVLSLVLPNDKISQLAHLLEQPVAIKALADRLEGRED